jgi:hypothetical protein
METKGKRGGFRLPLEIPIEVVGTDCLGSQFFDRTHTLVIGRHGGKVVLERVLVPQQEITIRCIATGREVEASILGLIAKKGRAYHYGIKFLGEEENIWGIQFPPLTESERTAGRESLQCIKCKKQERISLDDFELEVLEISGHLSRDCKSCGDVSLWRILPEHTPGSGTHTPASLPATAAPFKERRHESRREMQVSACVRTARFGEDMVKTRSVSRRGLSFESRCDYVQGEAVEVAAPYSPRGGNIFLPAKIVRLQRLPSGEIRSYGIVFQNQKG